MDLKCPFAAPQALGRAACSKANDVVRRGGVEYDCVEASAHARCAALFNRMKPIGLSAFAVEDDLTQMPHSVLVKIQAGGLVGLKRSLGESAEQIADIHQLIEQCCDRAGGVDHVSVEPLAAEMTGYKLERRARRNR